MKHAVLTAAFAALVALPSMVGDRVFAQAGSGQQDALRRDVERRFDVAASGADWVLRPKSGDNGARSIEFTGGSISVDGTAATGAELREKLGADADTVLRLSYLDPEARRELLSDAAAQSRERSIEPRAERDRSDDRTGSRDESRRPGRRARRGEGDSDGDRVRFGGTISVEEGELVRGDVVAIAGSTRIDGEVTGDAVAIGGGLELGPHANVRGDAVSIGGAVKRDPGARVGGKVVDVGSRAAFRFGSWPWNGSPGSRRLPFGPMFLGAAAGLLAFMGTVMRVAVLCLLSSIVVFVGREYVERVGARAAAEPLKAGAIGLLAQLLFGPLLILTVVVLVITIVGIPLLLLLPFALLALGVVLLVGFTGVAYNVGRLASERFAWNHDDPYLTTIAGIVLLVSPVLLGRLIGLGEWLLFPITGTLVFLGLLAEYLAWTVGFGAVALLRFERSATIRV